jgi:hypothetical protein
MSLREGTDVNSFIVRGLSLKRGSGLRGFVFLLLCLHQNLSLIILMIHLLWLCLILMMITLMMAHLLHHQEGEFHASDGDLGGNTGGDFANDFNPGGMVIMMMNMTLLNISVQDIQGEIERRRTP